MKNIEEPAKEVNKWKHMQDMGFQEAVTMQVSPAKAMPRASSTAAKPPRKPKEAYDPLGNNAYRRVTFPPKDYQGYRFGVLNESWPSAGRRNTLTLH